MKTRTIIEMRDGLRGDRLIRASTSRGGDLGATKRYMLQAYLRSYLRLSCGVGSEGMPEELPKTRRAIVWRVVQEDELGQEIK